MKGMVNGEPIKTGALTKEYEDGHARAFGEPKPFPRGRRFVWSTTEGRLIPAGLVQEKKALDAPVMVDRFYENAKATDGTDIGSRKKHRAYMKEHNLTTADDFKDTWAKKQEERRRIREEGVLPDKTRREDVARALHHLYKP